MTETEYHALQSDINEIKTLVQQLRYSIDGKPGAPQRGIHWRIVACEQRLKYIESRWAKIDRWVYSAIGAAITGGLSALASFLLHF